MYVELPGLKHIRRSDYPDLLRDLQLAHNYYFDLKRLEMLMALGGFILVHGDETIKAWFQQVEFAKAENRKDELCRQLKHRYKQMQRFIYLSEKLRMYLYLRNNASSAIRNPRAFYESAKFFVRHSMF